MSRSTQKSFPVNPFLDKGICNDIDKKSATIWFRWSMLEELVQPFKRRIDIFELCKVFSVRTQPPPSKQRGKHQKYTDKPII
jgi:hypothetical protein